MILKSVVKNIVGVKQDSETLIHNFTNNKIFSVPCGIPAVFTGVVVCDTHVFAECVIGDTKNNEILVISDENKKTETKTCTITYMTKEIIDETIGEICDNIDGDATVKHDSKLLSINILVHKLNDIVKKNDGVVAMEQEQEQEHNRSTTITKIDHHNKTADEDIKIPSEVSVLEIENALTATKNTKHDLRKNFYVFNINISETFRFLDYTIHCSYTGEEFTSTRCKILQNYPQYYTINDNKVLTLISLQQYIHISCYKSTRLAIKDKFGNVVYGPNFFRDLKMSAVDEANELVVQLILAKKLNIIEYYKIAINFKYEQLDMLKKILNNYTEVYRVCFYDTTLVEFFFGHRNIKTIIVDYDQKNTDHVNMFKNKIGIFSTDYAVSILQQLTSIVLDEFK